MSLAGRDQLTTGRNCQAGDTCVGQFYTRPGADCAQYGAANSGLRGLTADNGLGFCAGRAATSAEPPTAPARQQDRGRDRRRADYRNRCTILLRHSQCLRATRCLQECGRRECVDR